MATRFRTCGLFFVCVSGSLVRVRAAIQVFQYVSGERPIEYVDGVGWLGRNTWPPGATKLGIPIPIPAGQDDSKLSKNVTLPAEVSAEPPKSAPKVSQVPITNSNDVVATRSVHVDSYVLEEVKAAVERVRKAYPPGSGPQTYWSIGSPRMFNPCQSDSSKKCITGIASGFDEQRAFESAFTSERQTSVRSGYVAVSWQGDELSRARWGRSACRMSRFRLCRSLPVALRGRRLSHVPVGVVRAPARHSALRLKTIF